MRARLRELGFDLLEPRTLPPTGPLIDMRADHRSARGWSESDVLALYEQGFAPDDRQALEAEFRSLFPRDELVRLAVKFGRALALFDTPGAELSLCESETLTTSRDLLFCLHWLHWRGAPVVRVAPNLALKQGQPYPEDMAQMVDYTRPKLWIDLAPRTSIAHDANPIAELEARARELCEVAAAYDAALSVHFGDGKQLACVQAIGRATSGRVDWWTSATHPQELISLAQALRG